MIEFMEYADDKIKIKLPKQLRQKQQMHFFCGNLIRGKPETCMTVGIDFNYYDDARVESMKQIIQNTQLHDRPSGDKVERFGSCEYGNDGIELLTSFIQPITGYVLFDWSMFFCLKGSYVHLGISGGGNREEFESIAREIVSSLVLLSPSEENKTHVDLNSSKIKHIKPRGLRAKQKARLTKALESIPDDLKYLREPILVLADEDQEMLGCGEGDASLLIEALQKQSELHSQDFASDHAQELEQWLHEISSPEDLWAGPMWFVLGYLMSYDFNPSKYE